VEIEEPTEEEDEVAVVVAAAAAAEVETIGLLLVFFAVPFCLSESVVHFLRFADDLWCGSWVDRDATLSTERRREGGASPFFFRRTLQRTPHALHSVPFPSGPRRHIGVVSVWQKAHTLAVFDEDVVEEALEEAEAVEEDDDEAREEDDEEDEGEEAGEDTGETVIEGEIVVVHGRFLDFLRFLC